MRSFTPPDHHEERPPIITRIIGKFAQFASNPEIIPELAFRHIKGYLMRSELRESIPIVLGCLVHYMDLVSMRVMKPQHDGSWVGLTNCEISELTGLFLSRVNRAMKELKRIGWITVKRTYEKNEKGEYKGRAAVRLVSPKLFQYFRLDKKLKRERDRAYERVKSKAENPPKGSKAEASRDMLKSIAKERLKEIKKLAGFESPDGVEPVTEIHGRVPP